MSVLPAALPYVWAACLAQPHSLCWALLSENCPWCTTEVAGSPLVLPQSSPQEKVVIIVSSLSCECCLVFSFPPVSCKIKAKPVIRSHVLRKINQELQKYFLFLSQGEVRSHKCLVWYQNTSLSQNCPLSVGWKAVKLLSWNYGVLLLKAKGMKVTGQEPAFFEVYSIYFPVSILLWAHSSSKNRCFYSSSICRMSSHYTGWEGSQVHLHRLSVSDSPRFKQTFWATKRWHAVRKQKYGLCISKGLCFWRVTPVFSCTWLQIHTSTLTAFTSISTL